MSQLTGRRKFLGRSRAAFASSTSTYLTDEWIEVDESDGTVIRRERVPFEDVLLVTRHMRRPWLVSLVLGGLGLLWAIPGAIIMATAKDAGAVGGGAALLVLGLVIATPMSLMLFVGIKCVSVFGDRSKARMGFYRRSKADEAYETIMARIRRARRNLEAANPPPPPPPQPEDASVTSPMEPDPSLS